MGRPKKFESGEDLLNDLLLYLDDIRERGFEEVPTKANFCKFLSRYYGEDCNRTTVYHSLKEYYNDFKKDFEQALSDFIAEGGMLGKYQSTMTIFCLKNWYSWTDNKQVDVTTSNDAILDTLKGIVNAD